MDVIVDAGAGGRPLLRTADALIRQTCTPSSIVLLTSRSGRAPLVDSIANRLSAVCLDGADSRGAPLNAAVRTGRSPFIFMSPAGFLLDPTCFERLLDCFRRDPAAAAIAVSVALRTADGIDEVLWSPSATSVLALLTDTRSLSPVFAVRRDVWESLGGFDETLDGLIEYAFWLDLLAAGHKVLVLDDPLAARELTPQAADDAVDAAEHVRRFRALLDRRSGVVQREMAPLVVEREVRFGQLREIHRELLQRRDRDLAELDRLRSEAAHHRAYLTHHGYDGFDWGELRRVSPVSRDWGYDRGAPVDRRYIEDFVAAHSSDIRGKVLEVQEDDFSIAFGGPRTTERAILDIDASNPRATVLADLRRAPELPSSAFDCVVLTQTLHVIDDMPAALEEVYRILAPDGVLLATFPTASRVCLEYGLDGDYWRLTRAGARALFRSSFAPAHTSYDTFGNVLTNAAFLYGLGAGELTGGEYDAHDPYFPALVGVRARKTTARPTDSARGLVLLYHRVDDTPDVHGLAVPHALFEAQMQWLQSNCSVVPLDELLTAAPEHWPERAVAVTFDDGYEDTLRHGVPVLQQHLIPATYFLTTRWLEEPGEYWWDLLERVLLHDRTPPELTLDLNGSTSTFPTRTMPERSSAHWQVHDALVHASLEQRDRATVALRSWGGRAQPRLRPMVADEVRALARVPGIAIGAHTVNHLSLPDNPARVRNELADCRRDLERVTGQPVEVFAYPYGAVDRASAAEVRRSLRWGLSCEERTLGDSFDAARVPRLDVKAWRLEDFAARVESLFRFSTAAQRPAALRP